MNEPENEDRGDSRVSGEFPETFGISPELLKILVCPMAHAELKIEDGYLICTRCGPRFKIDEGIPIMLIDEAELPEGVSRVEDLPCYSEVKERESGG